MKKLIGFIALAGVALAQAQQDDVLLRAMRDELERSRQLRVESAGFDPLYFISYSVEEGEILGVSASMGALISQSHSVVKIPEVRVRVGSMAFDNSNHVFSDFYTGSRYDPDQLPQEDNYGAIRQVLWLATDRAYKTAQEAIGRKRSALKNVNQTEQFPDYSPIEPVKLIEPVKPVKMDDEGWKSRVVKLSGIFTGYPSILSSGLEFQSILSTDYLMTSEGTAIRTPETITFLRIRGFAQAPDGMQIRDAAVVQTAGSVPFPGEAELKRAVTGVADELTALVKAPLGEAYDGPVLFEPQAAAQLFAQVLGDNLKITRKPVAEPGRNVPYLPSELETKVGSRILPDWIDIADDPTLTEFRGQPLFGHYDVDSEGVRPKPLNLVEKGVLKTFLLTRTPVKKGLEASNGRARLHGSHGAAAPGYGNLIVRANQTVPNADLKKRLLEMMQQRSKPYGMLVRKLDYPSSMSFDELRRATASMAQSGEEAGPSRRR